MEPLPNNTRYLLELERNALIQLKYMFDEKYGTFSFAFLTSLEAFALLAYLYIATVLIYYKKTRTKTNFIVSVWAIINFLVLLEKLSRAFGTVLEDDFHISEDLACLSQMISGLARSYGTLLSIVWLFSKFFGTPKQKYNIFIHLLILIPALVCFFYIYYYFAVNKFIVEVYGPGCDVVNAVVYLTVGFLFILCKIFISICQETTQYALLISLVNLITNFPNSLLTIYLRFNLDISWSYRFHLYFADFLINALISSGAFAVLFLIILYNEKVRQNFFVKREQKVVEIDPEQIKMTAI